LAHLFLAAFFYWRHFFLFSEFPVVGLVIAAQ